jgi:hypothetical protein
MESEEAPLDLVVCGRRANEEYETRGEVAARDRLLATPFDR